MAKTELKHSASYPLLSSFLLFFFALSFTLPSTAGATVAAYLDVKGNLHYVRGKNKRPLAQSTGDLGPQAINIFIQAAATEHRVDPLLIKAVIKAESNFDSNAVSAKGAQGLMQLMPGTAKDLSVVNPFDPLQNINGGTKYLRRLLDSYNGDIRLSLAAYNAGPGNVTPQGMKAYIPETQEFVARVMGHYSSYRGGMASLSNITINKK